MRLALVVLVLTSSIASADVRLEAHLGGGLEGGLITGALRPDAVGETGVRVLATLPGRSWGFGVNLDRIGRLTQRAGTHDEAKLDVTLAWTRRDTWIAVGVGMRSLGIERDSFDEDVRGYDFIHIASGTPFKRWETSARTQVSIDGYLAWSFGCYMDTMRGAVVGDMPAPTEDVQCSNTFTTSYTLGVATSVRWR